MLTEEEALHRFVARFSPEARGAIHVLEIAGPPEVEAALHRIERVLVDASCTVAGGPKRLAESVGH